MKTHCCNKCDYYRLDRGDRCEHPKNSMLISTERGIKIYPKLTPRELNPNGRCQYYSRSQFKIRLAFTIAITTFFLFILDTCFESLTGCSCLF